MSKGDFRPDGGAVVPQSFHSGALILTLVWLGLGVAALVSVPTGPLVVVSIALACVTVAVELRRTSGDLFAPGVFLFGYVTTVMLSPWVYLVVTRKPIQIISVDTINDPVVVAMLLSVSGWGFGTMVVRARSVDPVVAGRHQIAVLSPTVFDDELAGRLRVWGWGTLLVTGALRVFLVAESTGRAYGEGQFTYTLGAALTPVSDVTLILAVVFFCAAALADRGPIIPTAPATMLGVVALLSMFGLGTRGELIAPGVVILWCAWRLGRIDLRHVAGVGAATVVMFFAVARLRAATAESLIERTMADISSPYLVTDWLTRYVPDPTGYLMGETYAATIPMLLPGPIARMLSGGDIGTGAYRFREVVGFHDPNQGFGFAMPAEAYLNFGMPGVFVIMALAAALIAFAHRRWVGWEMAEMGVLYALAIGAMPFGLRADALAQMKAIVFPMAIVGLIIVMERRAATRVAARSRLVSADAAFAG